MRALICLIALALICSSLAQTKTDYCFANGCTYATATDLTGSASATITTSNLKYTPACIKVDQNTAVTFNMNFVSHPLFPGYVENGTPTELLDSTDVTKTTSGATVTFTVQSWAAIPYYCHAHYPYQMYGVIYVGTACAGILPPTAPVATPVNPPAAPIAPPTAPVAVPVAMPQAVPMAVPMAEPIAEPMTNNVPQDGPVADTMPQAVSPQTAPVGSTTPTKTPIKAKASSATVAAASSACMIASLALL